LFSIERKRCTKVLSITGTDHVMALPGRDFSLISTFRDRTWSTVLISHDGKTRELAQNARGTFSMDGSRAALIFDDPPRFALLTKSGGLGKQIPMPASSGLQLTEDKIFADAEGGEVFVFNETSGEWVTGERHFPRPHLTFPAVFITGGRISGRGFNVPAWTALLGVDDRMSEGVLVIGSGTDRAASISDRAVLLLRGTAVTVREIVKIPAEDARQKIADTEKADAMKAAEAMARHFRIYAASHGDAYPERGSDLERAFFESSREGGPDPRFVYEFTGGHAKEPLHLVLLGYVPTRAGRAEVYADGRIVWVPVKAPKASAFHARFLDMAAAF
jgi:hypothetical protein